MRIRAYLDDVPLSIDTDMLQNAILGAALDGLGHVKTDDKAKMLRLGLKGVAKLFMEWVRFQAKLGKLPPPNDELLKQDALGYCIRYWTALTLAVMASQLWRVEYEEAEDGTLEITGLVAADGTPAISGADTIVETDDDASEETQPGATLRLDSSDTGRSLVRGGDEWQRQNDMGQATAVGTVETVA